MAVRKVNRRRWNNILILAVLAFIVVLNLPSLIKAYLLQPSTSEKHTYLLNRELTVDAFHFPHWSLNRTEEQWQLKYATTITEKDQSSEFSSKDSEKVTASELVSRWEKLFGTKVDASTYEQLKPSLRNPQSLEVWYQGQEEPQRITIYELPQFWLFNNWQNQWIALSVEKKYLFPPFPSSRNP